MPPKPQVFKSPDGKEFSTKAAWRDYMMATYYSFSNVKGAPYPMPRLPGSIDGQMYNISDCEDTELIVMDHCEQVQIDQVRNSKIFIGACESSMFIRNCDNCSFYIACRQLRLRDVTNCKFFCFSTAEVHIEYSNNVQFAPFNGGYPEQAQHLTKAKLPYLEHNLWYDIFDHNDPGKTREHWSLLPEAEYGPAWFPAGECERAIPLTKPGSVQRVDGDTTGDAGKESSLQSFALPHVAEAAGKSFVVGLWPGCPHDMLLPCFALAIVRDVHFVLTFIILIAFYSLTFLRVRFSQSSLPCKSYRESRRANETSHRRA